MTTQLASLCADCSTAWSAWLDYRLPPAPIQLCTPGRTRARDVQEARKHRFELWRTTIRDQQSLIERICGEGRCPTKRGTGR